MDIKNMTTEELNSFAEEVRNELREREKKKTAKAIEDFNTAVKNLAEVIDLNIPYEHNFDYTINLKNFQIKPQTAAEFGSNYFFTGLDYYY